MNMGEMHAALYRLGLEALYVLLPSAVRIYTHVHLKKKKKKEKYVAYPTPPPSDLSLRPF